MRPRFLLTTAAAHVPVRASQHLHVAAVCYQRTSWDTRPAESLRPARIHGPCQHMLIESLPRMALNLLKMFLVKNGISQRK